MPMFTLPMKAVANIHALANNEELLNLLTEDRTSADARVPLALVASMSSTSPPVEPEQFSDKPVLLVHPGEDRWVGVRLSRIFFDRLACKKELVILERAGHLPNERRSLDQMRHALDRFLTKAVERAREDYRSRQCI
jgi:alpha-beta hydrolase superfamily lysophospholipase